MNDFESKKQTSPTFFASIAFILATIFMIIGFFTILFDGHWQYFGLGFIILGGSFIVSGSILLLPHYLKQ